MSIEWDDIIKQVSNGAVGAAIDGLSELTDKLDEEGRTFEAGLLSVLTRYASANGLDVIDEIAASIASLAKGKATVPDPRIGLSAADWTDLATEAQELDAQRQKRAAALVVTAGKLLSDIGKVVATTALSLKGL